METLLENQTLKGEEIAQLYTNYKKDGADRKTKRYLEAKIAVLKKMYNEYIDGDNKVRPQLESSHKYFTDRKAVSENYSKFIEDMRLRLNEAPNTPTPTPSLTFNFGSTENLKNKEDQREDKSLSSTNLGCNISPKVLKQQDIRIRGLYKELRSVEDLICNNIRSRPALNLKLKNIERMMTQIMDLHEQICIEASEEDESTINYFIDHHYENVNEEYSKIVIQLTTELEDSTSCSTQVKEISLKPIEIPNFHGDYMKWVSFADVFKRLIHDNKQLTNTHKIHYLKAHVAGSAAKLLNHLEPTGENYEAAWNILENRYNNKRLLVSNLLNTLLNQAAILAESAAAIRNLHDTTTECLHAISNTGIDISTWNPFIIITLLKKLDNESRRLYESSLENPREFQTTTQFLKFLERRFQSLESMGGSKSLAIQQQRVQYQMVKDSFGGNKSLSTQQTRFQPSKQAFVTSTYQKQITNVCICCQRNHKIDACQRFKELTLSDRNQMVMLHNLCRICLCQNHQTANCSSNTKCVTCKGYHHTLLHIKDQKQHENSYTKLNISSFDKNCDPVLLATALVKVRNINGGFNLFRALIDPGSQATFITEEAAQQLGTPKFRVLAEVSGIAASKGRSHQQTTIDISPRFPSLFNIQTNALILKTITKPLPDNNILGLDSELQNGIILADPTFDTRGPIDLLIGADIYGEIMLEGIKRDSHHKCIAQNTEIGWIISGRLTYKTNVPVTRLNSLITLADIDKQLKNFWESEELHPKRMLTAEEVQCEEHYEKTHKRLKNGCYEVQIPFNSQKLQVADIGNSKYKAAARLLQMEKRFGKDEKLKNHYHKFMEEYLQLNHMEPVQENSRSKAPRVYYLPHHSIVKEESTTTKLRVVFDASCKTTTGTSLNEIMHVGPTLQDNLTSILIRWKKHRYVITSDIEKMFRQIRIARKDQDLQRILWRSDPTKPMKSYRLKTVTYGTASATYLATKTLNQLAIDDASKYPIGSKIAQRDFYVDDLLSGANTITEAIIARQELRGLLSGGGFNLRKWASNNKEILEGLPDDLKESGLHTIEFDDTVKTLGLIWNSTTDTFQFRVSQQDTITTISKRTILSESSKLFDPLGWLAPVIIQAKILLQDLWASGVGWDDKLSSNFGNRWLSYKLELPQLEKIRIPRWMSYTTGIKTELHGFCDASSKAYAAVIYSKINSQTTIVAAKTRVAPLNQTISLPRLELNAALLLAKLLKNVLQSLDINHDISVFCWTDSMAVLGWIKGQPQNHKTFVANRITEIQSITNPSQWHHVTTNENPADCASRGLNPSQILSHNIWWEGPTWLKSTNYPTTYFSTEQLEQVCSMEQKAVKTFTTAVKQPIINFNRFSSVQQLVRSIAYCLRFSTNTRTKIKNLSYLSPGELNASLMAIIKIIQHEAFVVELKQLESTQGLSKDSTIRTLNPFLDGCGIIRVGGRLANSTLSYEEKHPIILPGRHRFSKLLVEEAHIKTLHGGNQATLAYLRTKYWVIRAKDIIRHTIHNCIICVRGKKLATQQLMGILPKERVTPAPPFSNSGVDYAGPISIKLWKGRCNKIHKGYIAIFICLATKAIHLELVSDLSTEAFLAAYKRFISRRGICLKLFSDCGTNFVGANKQLQKQAKQQEVEIKNKIAQIGTEWHFIPPGSPHFGGLWEAGVKSTKQHLQKIIGTHTLTFEELSTLLAQIEACLNSRPLAPLSNDADDEGFLSPGHFLIGRAIISTPQPDMEGINAVTRWNLLTKLSKAFWKKWQTDYLSRLQHRPKWLQEQPNIQKGELVILKDEQLPPTHWPLARVMELHPGSDGLVRVVTLRYKNSILKRNITKLCRLPMTSETDDLQLNDNQAQRKQPHRKAKPIKTTSHILALAMLSICCVLGLAQANMKINPLNHSTGIYFEEIGKLEVVAMKWTLVIYYNMTSYWKEIEVFKQAQLELKANCKDLPDLNCDIILQQLDWQFNILNTNNELLMTSNKERSRQKRGIGDTTGIVLGDMFGILTQREASRYEDQFENINQNENHLMALMKNQTSIIDNTIKLMKHNSNLTMTSVNNLIKDQQQLKEEMSQLNEYRTYEKRVRSAFTSMIELIMIMKNLEETQHGLLAVVNYAHQEILHPSILAPGQLENQLQLIRHHIPASITIPGHEMHDLIHIYQSMNIRSRVTQRNVIIEVIIPLSFAADYKLIAVIPIPNINHGKTQTQIVTSTEYVAMDNHREHFAFLTREEVKQCQVFQSTQFLCEISPIFNTMTIKGQCEVAILQRKMELDKICNIKTINATNQWIKLHAPNEWIYVVPNETTVDVICGSTINTYNIQGSGRATIDAGCILREENFYIVAVGAGYNNISRSFHESSGRLNGPINLKNLGLLIKNKTTIDHNLLAAPDTADLEKELAKIKEDETFPADLNHHDIHHYTVSYSIIGILVVFLAIYWYKRRPAAPQPLQRPDVEV